MTELTIEELHDDHVDQVIAVINAAFGFNRSSDWYEWKHREGPWGPSRGLVARDASGIVGVRLLLPWRFVGPGGAVLAYRAVEAATSPRAMGQGVFSQLNRHLMRIAEDGEEATFLFSTPNEQSRGAYRKLGWNWLEPVAHVWRPIFPARGTSGARRASAPAADVVPSDVVRDRIATDWSSESLKWRLDPRSGRSYEILEADVGNAGLVYRRTIGTRLPGVLPLHKWGNSKDVRRLLRRAAHQERVAVVVDTGDRGGDPVSRAPGPRRGGSLLAVWKTSGLSSGSWPLDKTANWRLRFADLESVL